MGTINWYLAPDPYQSRSCDPLHRYGSGRSWSISSGWAEAHNQITKVQGSETVQTLCLQYQNADNLYLHLYVSSSLYQDLLWPSTRVTEGQAVMKDDVIHYRQAAWFDSELGAWIIDGGYRRIYWSSVIWSVPDVTSSTYLIELKKQVSKQSC